MKRMKREFENWLGSLRSSCRPDEFEAKQLLRLYGIPVPPGFRLSPDECLSDRISDKSMPGPFFVAKVCSAEILHKTEQSGVKMDLDVKTLPVAVQDLRDRFPGTPVLIEEQVRHSGSEFILGALVDPALGTALMIGAGGILTELYQDVAFRLAPCSLQEARRMIEELVIAPVLNEFRGIKMDTEGLAGIIALTGRIVLEMGACFNQLDINPLVYADGGWIALDAKLLLNE